MKKMIRKTTAAFIWLGAGFALMIAAVVILWPYKAMYSCAELVALFLLALGAYYIGLAVHQVDEVDRDNQRRLREIRGEPPEGSP